MLREKISPELYVAAVLSIVILLLTGAMSYVSKNNAFISAGFMTVVLNAPAVLFKNKL